MSREGEEKARREKVAMEPTVPATEVKSGLPDFASERSMSDGGGSGSTAWVIVCLVVAVAGLFWWLSPPAAPKSPSPASPTSPAATKPVAPVKAAPAPPAPRPSTPVSSSEAAAQSSEAKSSAPPPHKHRRHHKKASAKGKPVKLPRLPSPPPAD